MLLLAVSILLGFTVHVFILIYLLLLRNSRLLLKIPSPFVQEQFKYHMAQTKPTLDLFSCCSSLFSTPLNRHRMLPPFPTLTVLLKSEWICRIYVWENNPLACCYPTERVSYFLKWVINSLSIWQCCHIDSISICPRVLFYYCHTPLTFPAACSFTALCYRKKRTCHMSEKAHTCLLMMLAKENKQIMTNGGSLICISTAWHKTICTEPWEQRYLCLFLSKIALDKTCSAFLAHL